MDIEAFSLRDRCRGVAYSQTGKQLAIEYRQTQEGGYILGREKKVLKVMPFYAFGVGWVETN
jgi:hypothetical protein